MLCLSCLMRTTVRTMLLKSTITNVSIYIQTHFCPHWAAFIFYSFVQLVNIWLLNLFQSRWSLRERHDGKERRPTDSGVIHLEGRRVFLANQLFDQFLINSASSAVRSTERCTTVSSLQNGCWSNFILNFIVLQK